jgi:hypothetical protein
VNEAAKAQRSMRRRLDKLAETQGWVHHVADLDSGEIQTTPLDRPVTPLSRAERLSRLGHQFDTTIFDGPEYRLTPRRPYQPSPEAWLEVSKPDYYAATTGDLLWWEPPRDLDIRTDFRGMRFFFALSPDRRAVASISLSGHAFEHTVGHILLNAHWTQASATVPIDGNFGTHTVDFTFLPPAPPQPTEIVMGLLAGIEILTFTGISFGAAPLEIDPGILAGRPR